MHRLQKLAIVARKYIDEKNLFNVQSVVYKGDKGVVEAFLHELGHVAALWLEDVSGNQISYTIDEMSDVEADHNEAIAVAIELELAESLGVRIRVPDLIEGSHNNVRCFWSKKTWKAYVTDRRNELADGSSYDIPINNVKLEFKELWEVEDDA